MSPRPHKFCIIIVFVDSASVIKRKFFNALLFEFAGVFCENLSQSENVKIFKIGQNEDRNAKLFFRFVQIIYEWQKYTPTNLLFCYLSMEYLYAICSDKIRDFFGTIIFIKAMSWFLQNKLIVYECLRKYKKEKSRRKN